VESGNQNISAFEKHTKGIGMKFYPSLDTGKYKDLESMAKAELSLSRCGSDHSMKD
jgi:hypothetical protein